MRADLWWYCIRNKQLRLDTANISTNLCRQKRREGTELREHNLWLFSMEVACSSFLRRWEYRRLYIFCSPFLFSCPGRYHLGILDTCDLLTRTCRDRNWSSWLIQLYPWPLLSRTVYILLNQCHLLIDTILLDTTCIRLRSFPRRKTGMMRYLRYLCTCLRHILCSLPTLHLPRTCFSHTCCMLAAPLPVGDVRECSSSMWPCHPPVDGDQLCRRHNGCLVRRWLMLFRQHTTRTWTFLLHSCSYQAYKVDKTRVLLSFAQILKGTIDSCHCHFQTRQLFLKISLRCNLCKTLDRQRQLH